MDFGQWFNGQKPRAECPCCGRITEGVEKRRMSSQYNDEESNWEETCMDCHLDHEETWKEMWAEYYSGCL